jgi:microcystin-dependent protein
VHSHSLMTSNQPGEDPSPQSEALARSVGASLYKSGTANVSLSNQAVALTGGSQPHNNLQPYLTLNFCIALQGVFPPRS